MPLCSFDQLARARVLGVTARTVEVITAELFQGDAHVKSSRMNGAHVWNKSQDE